MVESYLRVFNPGGISVAADSTPPPVSFPGAHVACMGNAFGFRECGSVVQHKILLQDQPGELEVDARSIEPDVVGHELDTPHIPHFKDEIVSG